LPKQGLGDCSHRFYARALLAGTITMIWRPSRWSGLPKLLESFLENSPAYWQVLLVPSFLPRILPLRGCGGKGCSLYFRTFCCLGFSAPVSPGLDLVVMTAFTTFCGKAELRKRLYITTVRSGSLPYIPASLVELHRHDIELGRLGRIKGIDRTKNAVKSSGRRLLASGVFPCVIRADSITGRFESIGFFSLSVWPCCSLR